MLIDASKIKETSNVIKGDNTIECIVTTQTGLRIALKRVYEFNQQDKLEYDFEFLKRLEVLKETK